MRPVTQGEPFRPEAATWNSFIETARRVARSKLGASQGVRLDGDSPTLSILAQNTTGADLDQFHVAKITDSLWNPSTEIEPFKFQTAVKLGAPEASGELCVASHPIASNGIGAVVFSGIVPVFLNVVDLSHEFADVVTGDPTKLASADSGPARIVSAPTATGLQWSLVNIAATGSGGGGGSSVVEVVKVTTGSGECTLQQPNAECIFTGNVVRIGTESADFTANPSTDVLTSVGHGMANGMCVSLSHDQQPATLPGGLSTGTDYFVISATANTFQLSLTDGGAAVDITDSGTGIHTATEKLTEVCDEPSSPWKDQEQVFVVKGNHCGGPELRHGERYLGIKVGSFTSQVVGATRDLYAVWSAEFCDQFVASAEAAGLDPTKDYVFSLAGTGTSWLCGFEEIGDPCG